MAGDGTLGARRVQSEEMITGKFVRNAWYMAAWAQDVTEGRVVGRSILGEPIAVFRKADGSLAAVQDRCPHRFAPLSMGRVIGGDTLQCLYHGLEFDGAGMCTKNPHKPGNIPTRARIKSYPVVEKHKGIWVWMGSPEGADAGKVPDFSVLDNVPELHSTKLDHIVIKANYELVVDNLLDLSHICYLHDGILGNSDTIASEIVTEQEGDDVIAGRYASGVSPPSMWTLQWPDAPPRVSLFTRIRWMAPSTLRLFAGISEEGKPYETGSGYHAIHLLTPQDEHSTLYHFTAVRFGVRTTDEALNRDIQAKIGKTRRFAFEEQDAPYIEAQQRMIDGADEALAPMNLSIDAGPVRYKHVLRRMIAAEQQA